MNLIHKIRPLCRLASPHIKPNHSTSTSLVHTATGPLYTNNSNSILNLRRRTLKDAFFRRRDNISEDYQLIYRAPMDSTIASCKHFATFSLSFAGAAFVYKYATNVDMIDLDNLTFGVGPTVSEGIEMLGFGAAFVAFNVALLVACSKYPLRIYRNKSSYIAMFEGYLPLSARPYPFTGGQVKETFNGILPWHESMYLMNKRSVLLLSNYFRTPSELIQMMEEPKKESEKADKYATKKTNKAI